MLKYTVNFDFPLKCSFVLLAFIPYISLNLLSIITLACLSLYILLGMRVKRFLLLVILSFFSFQLFLVLFRDMINLSNVNIRDLTEIIRLSVILGILYIAFSVQKDVIFINNVFSLLVVLDFFVSLSQKQFFPSFVADSVQSFYQSTYHIDNALGISGRAMGLFPDPSTHGLASSLLAIYFIWLYEKYRRSWFLIIFLFSVLSVIMSQSQTAFIALVFAMSIFVICNMIFIGGLKRLVVYGFCLSLVVGFFFWIRDHISYLLSLFRYGLGRSSFENRLDKTAFSIDAMHDRAAGVVFGWGKNYLGDIARALDNEYLFVYLVYGAPGLFLFVGLLVALLVFGLKRRNVLLLAVTILGVLAAYPSSFFLNLKLLFIYLSIVFVSFRDTKHRLSFTDSKNRIDIERIGA